MDTDILKEYYSALLDGDGSRLASLHIPRSDVFYVRAAIEAHTGTKYSLDRVERAMYLEGMLKRRDVKDPDRKRDWEDDFNV